MKNLFLLGISAAFFAVSCKTVSKAKVAQAEKSEFLKLKGDWEITTIDYDKGFKIKPFDEGADVKCFIGSHWRLIPNNYSGAYTLTGNNTCPSVIQPIKFEVKDENNFIFKKIANGTKAKANTDGYSMTLLNQSTDQFSLQQNVPFNGEIVKVVYNFQRTGMK